MTRGSDTILAEEEDAISWGAVEVVLGGAPADSWSPVKSELGIGRQLETGADVLLITKLIKGEFLEMMRGE